ncbi:hypothetical protein RR48_15074 [Papilio machaon]|uniref:Uncharacterized protein n=1 Tax=Papilio machaon TaxID=76193 RepID=A0A194R2G0_PAPMA|nr:hypothetical protein RR48_15074 [Papilio machaon]
MSKNKQIEYKSLLETEFKIDKLLQESCKSYDVRFLHEYNNIKDAAQVIIGHIANIEGTSVTEIHRRLNLTE